MDESELWTALATLKELNRETNALIELENQSLKIDRLQKLRDGLEELFCRLDRRGGGKADQSGTSWETKTAEKSPTTTSFMKRSDIFEDIPRRLATPLVAELKGWSFHVENPDKYHLIQVKFSPTEQTSICEKAVLLERYLDDSSRVLVKILGFGNESLNSDRLFCRIDDVVETLLSRLVSVPIKCEPLTPVGEPWHSSFESSPHGNRSDNLQPPKADGTDFASSVSSPASNSSTTAATISSSLSSSEFVKSRTASASSSNCADASITSTLDIYTSLQSADSGSTIEEKDRSRKSPVKPVRIKKEKRARRVRIAPVLPSKNEADGDAENTTPDHADVEDNGDRRITANDGEGDPTTSLPSSIIDVSSTLKKKKTSATPPKRRKKAKTPETLDALETESPSPDKPAVAKRKVGRPKKKSIEVKKSASDEEEEEEEREVDENDSNDELEDAVIEEMLITSDECRLCRSVVPFADVNAHMSAFHNTNVSASINAALKDENDDDDDDDDDDDEDSPNEASSVFQCAFCEHVAPEADVLDAHVQEKHAPPDPTFYCEFCALGFYTDVRLEVHRRIEHDQKSELILKQACDECGKSFAFEHSLKKHKIRRHGDSNQITEKEKRKRKYLTGKRGRSKGLNAVTKPPALQPCRVCEKEIEYKDAFNHMETAHGVLDECPFCPGTYRKLQRHISKVHNPKPALYCEVCGACFRTHSSLKGHRLNQHFKDQKRHVCDVCSTSFAFAYMLNNHKRALHEGIKTAEQPKNFVCDVCNRAFRTHELRRRHRLRVHTPELGEYVCNDCGKIMTDRQGFNNHILIHSEARNYVCDICSKAFRTNKNLHQHKLSHQPPRHECPYCQKKFIYACGLRAHKKQVHENPAGVVAVGGLTAAAAATAADLALGNGVSSNVTNASNANDDDNGIVGPGLVVAHGNSIPSVVGHSLLTSGLGVLTSTSTQPSSLIGRQSDPTIGAASVFTSSSTLQAMTSAMTSAITSAVIPSAVIPSGVITQNDLQKVMNSQELEKVMNPGELTLSSHLPHHHHHHHQPHHHHHHHSLHLHNNHHLPLHSNLGAVSSLAPSTITTSTAAAAVAAAKLVDGAGVSLPNHAATLSKLASGDLTATMGKMNPNDLGTLCKMTTPELLYLG